MTDITASAARALSAQARDEHLPGGRALRVVPGNAVAVLTAAMGAPQRLAEAAALDAGLVPVRYRGNMACYSLAEQAALLRAEILLVGLGGLGGCVLEILARAGLGRITVCDPEEFEESDYNRQVLCTRATRGGPKVRAAQHRAGDVNPAVEIASLEGAFACDQNGRPLSRDHEQALQGVGILADCLDGSDNKADMARAAGRRGIPLVSAGVAGQAGWVGVMLPGGPSPAEAMARSAPQTADRELQPGAPAPAVGLAASLQAEQILALAAGREPALAGKVLAFDLARMGFETVPLD